MASAAAAPRQQRKSISGSGVKQSLGPQLTAKIQSSRVLLVGAGGIGCELLKNLVCCGFGSASQTKDSEDADAEEQSRTNSTGAPSRKPEIVVIDLDTIDLSNLNRQFLFRKQHIKKPKALVAKETASQFNPVVHIDAHHASIFDKRYDVEFFEGFDVVFNALDNITARRHVNRMCLAADIPLIESGTTGFNGQVQAIKKGVTECYDCTEKPVQKSYAICTIRSTPSQPIHCIVWAKSYLLPELFGASEDEEEGSEMKETDGDNAEELAKLKLEAQALKSVRNLIGKPGFATEVFNKVFYDDIERLRSMSEMWKSRKPPKSLRFEAVCIDKTPEVHGEKIAQQDQLMWGLLDNLKVFCYSVQALSKRAQAGEKVIEFDKDDKDTLDFVASAANLRSHIFDIPVSTEWDIKQMAGNIIPAIATSNAITASLCVMQGFKILRTHLTKANAFAAPTANNHIPTDAQTSTRPEDGSLGGCKKVYLESKNTERLINSEQLAPPRPDCPVCSPFYAKVILSNTSSPTLQDLVDLIQSALQYDETDGFSLTLDSNIIYDPDYDDNLSKTLQELGIPNQGSAQFLTVTDHADDTHVDLVLSFVFHDILPGDAALALRPATITLPFKPRTTSKPAANEGKGITSVGDQAGEKRKREIEAELDEGRSEIAKRARTEETTNHLNNGDMVTVEEDDGPINLD